MINHISWVIGNTVVEHLNEDDATELHQATILWMEEVSCPHTLNEIVEFQYSVLDRVLDLSPTELGIEELQPCSSTLGASGEQLSLFTT